MQKIHPLFILIILLWLFPEKLFSQKDKTGEIIILGVVHNENENRNAQIMLPILKEINPDIILSETDTLSGYFKSDYSIIKPPLWYQVFRKIGFAKQMLPEAEVLYLFRKKKKEVIIYPFDIAIEKRNNYVKKQNKFQKNLIQDLNKLNNEGLIPEAFHPQQKLLITYTQYLYEITQQGYVEINRTVVTDSIRDMMHLEYNYLPALLDTASMLKKYKTEYMESKDYWELRNKKMAENILFFMQKHPGKRILIITGLLHKYILIDLLKPAQKNNSFYLYDCCNR
jgi:hypothetical protein